MGFPVLGEEGERAYAIRPYLAERKRGQPFSFLILEKDGTQKCTRKPLADTNRKERPFGFPILGGVDYGA